ncbi:oocyst wall protein OWP3 [Cardiosporidium cionae]|uniref:Oocyst wall protein OWP3 n=1 Tax=Cardiosporidium cionae TaxID=476202 RepID=A0ABQ7JFZ8_9APIC|nr:oocyst wall protein OWP3 [Cardiosporidium cionae]|eukprot:KAF8822946.1 oocyst wall protein OWP3 [Cardiosporidium cionae]
MQVFLMDSNSIPPKSATLDVSLPKSICPDGYTFDSSGKLCILESASNFVLECPEGCTVNLEGTCNCSEEVEIIYNCPTGYVLSTLKQEDKDNTVNTSNPDHKRNHPYHPLKSSSSEIQGEKNNMKAMEPIQQVCMKKRQRPAHVTCPDGTVIRENVCLDPQVIPPTNICEDGSDPSENVCVKKEEQPSLEVCPEKSILRERIIVWEPVSAVNLERDNSMAEQNTNVSPLQGLLTNGDNSPVFSSNPQGREQIDHVRDDQHDRDRLFNKVSLISQDDRDERMLSVINQNVNVEKTSHSPDKNYHRERKSSNVATGTGNIITSVVKECYSTNSYKAKQLCPANHILDGDVCRHQLVERVDMHCEEGYYIDERSHSCIKEVPSNPVYFCEEGYYLESHQCVKIEMHPPSSRCRDGYTYDAEEKMCIKIIKEAPHITCTESDALFDGENCEVRLSAPIQIRCDNGTMINDVCVERHIIPSKPVCLEGYNLDKERFRCTTFNVAPVKFACQDDDQLMDQNQCLESKTYPTELQCPASFTRENNICKKETVMQMKVQCPENYTLMGTECVTHTEKPANLQCEHGFTLANNGDFGEKTCEAVDTIPPATRCATGGFFEKEGKCIRQVKRPGIATCPHDDVYEGSRCVHISVTTPSLECPLNMYLDATGTLCSPTLTANKAEDFEKIENDDSNSANEHILSNTKENHPSADVDKSLLGRKNIP